MNHINFEKISRNLALEVRNIKWRYEQPDWLRNDIIFTILFEVNNRLFYITANKNNLVELLNKTNITGILGDIDVDVSGCFIKNQKALLWKDYFRLYFNNEYALQIVKWCVNNKLDYLTVNLISWNYYECPFNDLESDDGFFDNEKTLSINYFLAEKKYVYKITQFDLMNVLSRSSLANFTMYSNLKASTKGVYNNEGIWMDWETYFNDYFTEEYATILLKEHLLNGRHDRKFLSGD